MDQGEEALVFTVVDAIFNSTCKFDFRAGYVVECDSYFEARAKGAFQTRLPVIVSFGNVYDVAFLGRRLQLSCAAETLVAWFQLLPSTLIPKSSRYADVSAVETGAAAPIDVSPVASIIDACVDSASGASRKGSWIDFARSVGSCDADGAVVTTSRFTLPASASRDSSDRAPAICRRASVVMVDPTAAKKE